MHNRLPYLLYYKTYIYQASKKFWKKKKNKFSRQVAAILIIGGKLKF